MGGLGKFKIWGGTLPWQWQWEWTLFTGLAILLLTVLFMLWAWSGRERKFDPDAEHRAHRYERFAGVIGEATGKVPLSMIVFMLTIWFFIIAYLIKAAINGYAY